VYIYFAFYGSGSLLFCATLPLEIAGWLSVQTKWIKISCDERAPRSAQQLFVFVLRLTWKRICVMRSSKATKCFCQTSQWAEDILEQKLKDRTTFAGPMSDFS
jgi:hypothetical protein